MSDNFIDYSTLVDEAMHIIVRKSLEKISRPNFKGEHHFFISFITKFPGVQLSEKLRKKYPKEMTIVLQYQFEDLKVNDKGFSVILSFDNVRERVAIPFSALTAFADPSVKFGLQFRHYHEEDAHDIGENDDQQVFEVFQSNSALASNAKSFETVPTTVSEKTTKKKSNVVALDTFRKK